MIFRARRWSLSLKVSLLVAVLMALVGGATSYIVLQRFVQDQETHLRQLARVHLNGIEAAVAQHVVNQDVWGTFEALEARATDQAELTPNFVVVVLPDRTVLAASDPLSFPVGSLAGPGLQDQLDAASELTLDEVAGIARSHRTMRQGSLPIGDLISEIDIRQLLAERRDVLQTLLLFNGVLTLGLAALGYLLVGHMLRPLRVLDRHVEKLRTGEIEPIPQHQLGREATEFGRLFRRFNAMATALRERNQLQARLVDEEKVALLGRLASGIAHEVNNPLAGMMNTVDTLRRHGEHRKVRSTSLDLLERGLLGIRDVVKAVLVTYKGYAEVEDLTRAGVDDLQHLIKHEVSRRDIAVRWHNRLPPRVGVDGSAVRQVALNLLLNSCAATPVKGCIEFTATVSKGALRLTVADQGNGLSSDMARLLLAKGEGRLPDGDHGLGLWTVARLLGYLDANVTVETNQAIGTKISIDLKVREEQHRAVA